MMLNCTAHDIKFSNGEVLKPYKMLKAERRFVTSDFGPNGEVLIREIVEPTVEGKQLLREIKEKFGDDVLIIGSYFSARAYPKRVVRLIPENGYEGVLPKERVYKIDKFLVY